MTKPGKEYEQFVYEKLRRFFPEAVVTLNDRILGRESALAREIDVSVRMSVEGAELLYIVQCKDWSRRVDVNTLGALSAVMQDVAAAKGFLLCTSGFYESNYDYARARGIELITIEDVESDKWTATVQIPYVYVRLQSNFELSMEICASAELVEANVGRELVIDFADIQVRSKDSSPIGVTKLISTMSNDRSRRQREGRVDLTTTDLGSGSAAFGQRVRTSHSTVTSTVAAT